jgi:hypothetical protein
MSDNNDSVFGDVIYSYTRANAIADGVLVDLSQVETVKAKWKFPFACTDTVYSVIQTAITEDGKDLEGVMHDIGTMAKMQMLRGDMATDTLIFEVIIGRRSWMLKLHIGPGDTTQPVMTLMLPNED